MCQPSRSHHRQHSPAVQRFPLAGQSCATTVSLWIEHASLSSSGFPLLLYRSLIDGLGSSDDASSRREAFESTFAGRGAMADAITPQPRVEVRHG